MSLHMPAQPSGPFLFGRRPGARISVGIAKQTLADAAPKNEIKETSRALY